MSLRNVIPSAGKFAGTRLDAAIIASVLAMGALNLLVLVDQIAPATAFAAAPCNCALANVTLA